MGLVPEYFMKNVPSNPIIIKRNEIFRITELQLKNNYKFAASVLIDPSILK